MSDFARSADRVTTLCRLLVDPKLVRVAIRRRRSDDKWLVTVSARSRSGARGTVLDFPSVHERVEWALLGALDKAADLPGVDLTMSWSFSHPFGRIQDCNRDHDDLMLRREIATLLSGEREPGGQA